jgi:hypothetical protein
VNTGIPEPGIYSFKNKGGNDLSIPCAIYWAPVFHSFKTDDSCGLLKKSFESARTGKVKVHPKSYNNLVSLSRLSGSMIKTGLQIVTDMTKEL